MPLASKAVVTHTAQGDVVATKAVGTPWGTHRAQGTVSPPQRQWDKAKTVPYRRRPLRPRWRAWIVVAARRSAASPAAARAVATDRRPTRPRSAACRTAVKGGERR